MRDMATEALHGAMMVDLAAQHDVESERSFMLVLPVREIPEEFVRHRIALRHVALERG